MSVKSKRIAPTRAPEPPKATPGGKAEPTPPAKVREGKGTP